MYTCIYTYMYIIKTNICAHTHNKDMCCPSDLWRLAMLLGKTAKKIIVKSADIISK